MRLSEAVRRRVSREAPPSADAGRAWGLYWAFLLPALLILFQFGLAAPMAAGLVPGLGVLLAMTGLADLSVLAVSWFVLCFIPRRPLGFLGLGLPSRKWDLLLLPVAGFLLTALALPLMNALYSFLNRGAGPPPQPALQLLGSAQHPLERTLALLVAGLLAPVAEEIVFRGVTFRVLRRPLGVPGALLLSSALFAAAHLDLHHLLPMFAIGAILAWMVSRCDSVVPGILLHVAINAGSLLLSW